MASKMNLLAFDLGAESGRAILGQLDEGKIALSEIHRFLNQPVSLPDGLHWDILQLLRELKFGLTKAAHSSDNLSSLGIDTWGVDFGLLDQKDELVGNPYHYRDNRTDGMIEKACERIPREDIFAQTGIQFMQFNSLTQLLSMSLSNSPALKIAQTFLTIPDLLNFWLTGRKNCEFTNATTTQCYNPLKQTWAKPILERLSIPTHIFPEIVPPGTVLGDLLPSVREECNLGRLPVIAPACHDTGSAVAAVPAEAGDFAWISSGTWSIMGVETRTPVINAQSLHFNMTNEGGVNDTFRLSKNIMGLWLVQECRRTWARQGKEYSYDDLTQLAAQASSLQTILDPDDNDFLKPGDMPSRIQAYARRTHQPVPETPGEIVRCCLEGIALRYRWVLERLEQLQNHPLPTLHIVGGGTRNRLLSQFTADATHHPVITGPIEATAVGNLLVQAIAIGEIASLNEARAIIRSSFEVSRFDPAPDRAIWDEAYGKFSELTPV